AVLPAATEGGGTVVVGAHYDTVPGSPGADDNASGVATVLELARRFRGRGGEHTIRFVFFVNEEPPFFKGELMGSRVYARWLRSRGEKVVGMLSVESVGYFSDARGSQSYPFPNPGLYPGTGNFIGFVSNLGSQPLLMRALRSFRGRGSIPSEGLAAPGLVAGTDWSDHASFWEQGFPALMVTDTAPFRNPHYHTAGDLPERLDFRRMAEVAEGLAAVVEDLAGVRPK
ncbi:MAG TPA: M20/M25/M40 family metallo-hydrolase, partial [Verrucomicrobiae bacterium]|nr:M20/M25/M40 family metallo-hydrolase [Verrucomicrobiae bacterium]